MAEISLKRQRNGDIKQALRKRARSLLRHNKYTVQSSKDIIKIIRSFIELIVLAAVIYFIIRVWFDTNVYIPFSLAGKSAPVTDRGFIAVSYPAVERKSSISTVGAARLDEQLKALSDSGYITISQQDIIDYYSKGKPLPEKSLFLLFEDGNRETSIFAQKVMENYNYRATVLNFGNAFVKKDPMLLSAKDMMRMEESRFWEFGTSGYRMEYINIFDKEGSYLGEMEPYAHSQLENAGNDYEHYLMDYIRDAKRLPKESYDGMTERITGEYINMKKAYESQIGYLPELYAIVSPNTGSFGHNQKVSDVNERNIYQYFKINFNRSGRSKNDASHSVYDLTRTQVQPYWRTNHLLMRVWSDTNQPVAFITGDAEKSKSWSLKSGAAQFVNEEIVLTTLPGGKGELRLNDIICRDLDLSVELHGNKLGSQSVLLRTDENLEIGVIITVKDNILYINEMLSKELGLVNLFTLDLDYLDKRRENINEVNRETAGISVGEPGSRLMRIKAAGNKLTVYIDETEAVRDIDIQAAEGYIGLRAETSVITVNERTPLDNIYDGVFERLVITDIVNEAPIYDNRLKNFDAAAYTAVKIWTAVTDWFITNF